MYWARYRLEHAQGRLDRLGPLSQLRRHGRQEKASALDDIDRFTADVHRAEAKTDRCREELERLRTDRDRRLDWDAEHGWPDERFRAVDAEWASITSRDHDIEPHRRTHLLERRLDPEHEWLNRIAEVSRPPLPGPDHGIDLGL